MEDKMFFKKNSNLAQKAQEVEEQFAKNPFAVVEVDQQTADYMGAFLEDAVTLKDFDNVEPGALDWFFNSDEPLAAAKSGKEQANSSQKGLFSPGTMRGKRREGKNGLIH
jgi:hypothetical protein